MSEKQTYQQREITQTRLTGCIRNLVEGGVWNLPSERDLCKVTGGSRNVIRSLLTEMEEKGTLLRRNNKREIANFEKMRKAIPLAFLAWGFNSVVNRSWAKLWLSIEHQAPDFGIKPELILVNGPLPAQQETLRKLQNSPFHYIVATFSKLTDQPPFELTDKYVIYTDEQVCTVPGQRVICMDNREVGHLAARALAEAGYKRPAIVADILAVDYLPFQNRIEGFLEECARQGLPCSPDDIFRILVGKGSTTKSRTLDTIDIAERIVQIGTYDSIFSITEERVHILGDIFDECGLNIPDDIALISPNATNTSTMARFPFTTISLATDKTARSILQTVSKDSEGDTSTPLHIKLSNGILNPEYLIRKSFIRKSFKSK
jgi:DNA-binding LacI/PurR family transcriptional regulator